MNHPGVINLKRDIEQTTKNTVNLLAQRRAPIHYKQAYHETVSFTDKPHSDKVDPVEKYRQTYGNEHPHPHIICVDGYLFLRRWFPDRRQLRLLAPESEVFIEGNCLVSYDAGYNYGRRVPYMKDWYNDRDSAYRYERSRRAYLVEQHVKNFFALHYPAYYCPASNERDYQQPATDDFSLVIPSTPKHYKIVIDVKSFSDNQDGNNNGVIRSIKNEVTYLWADWLNDECVKLYGLGSGQYLKPLGLELGDLTIIQDKHLLDIDILFVALNMAKMGMDYKHYKNKIGFYITQAVLQSG